MTQTAEVPALEPVSDLLCEAIGLGLKRQPVTLPSSAGFRYAAITPCLSPRILVKEPHLRRRPLPGPLPPTNPWRTRHIVHPGQRHTVCPVYPVRLARAMGLCGSVRIWNGRHQPRKGRPT